MYKRGGKKVPKPIVSCVCTVLKTSHGNTNLFLFNFFSMISSGTEGNIDKKLVLRSNNECPWCGKKDTSFGDVIWWVVFPSLSPQPAMCGGHKRYRTLDIKFFDFSRDNVDKKSHDLVREITL